ncbi:hypothetical protein N657DRAFT_583143 [Parathielavia appendiculata]|uniref:Uncharacterized protein n=1 Tax=Parathielavia appendiculata TaxID=2587402 RepID=A0AAN6TQ95_9PEZI|nr:hypothetical protein N657DRAFT_583143 [Parathielavia appendiculata]
MEIPAAGDVAVISHSQHHNQDHQDHQDQQSEPQTGQQQSEHQYIDPALSCPAAPFPTPTHLLSAFPKKRRGRPPGRPNTTVRDADYEHNPLVKAWNAAKNDRAIPMLSIRIRDALTEQSLVHETQRAIFRLPSRETILFVQGWITAKHIASQRPSYVNGLLIHSRGQDAPSSCLQCSEKRAKSTLGPFLTCRVLPGSYHNSCSNCKWFDNTSNCSLYTGPKPNRKRKAKEQLPQPPAAGFGPPENADGTNGHDTATAAEASGEGSALPTLQPLNHQPPEHLAMPISHPAGNNNQSVHSPPHTEVSGSEHPDAPSQSDSVANSHFILPKHNQDEDAHEVDDDNAE